ncbi:MAG TPA: hypothetical protein VFL99_00095 [Segeticoccus sp.]|uniref:hypothetical protein n=1 Tax=Segeticoccus sp. TaxID=2706531 RepID=UPI002D810DD6|nr:hypothetical protein [Segeticoccus sp.]HET8598697.1 hypothetical protein [Segeticoccus sp.]
MTEQRWTSAEDDGLRSQLALLRRDVEALPLADVRFVKARGRRRQRHRVLGAAAAAAAAVVVVGYVGFHDLDGHDESLVPAHPSASAPVVVAPTPSATASPTGTGGTSAGTSTSPDGAGPRAEPMQVVGTRPLLPPSLFVPAAQWSSEGLTAGRPTSDMAGDWEGSAAVGLCDVDDAQDGAPHAGRFGIVTVRDDGTGSSVGQQRIRLVDSAAAATAERDRLLAGLQACPSRIDGVAVTPAPGGRAPNAYRVDFTNPHGGPVVTDWVIVTPMTQRPAVSTIVLHGGSVNPTLQEGFAELQRLSDLADQ